MKAKLNKAGLICSIVHFGIIGLLLLNSSKNEIVWIWMPFLAIDFPVSLLSIGGMDFMIHVWGEPPYAQSWKESLYDNWPTFIHLIIGTIWWYYIPVIGSKLINKLADKVNQSK